MAGIEDTTRDLSNTPQSPGLHPVKLAWQRFNKAFTDIVKPTWSTGTSPITSYSPPPPVEAVSEGVPVHHHRVTVEEVPDKDDIAAEQRQTTAACFELPWGVVIPVGNKKAYTDEIQARIGALEREHTNEGCPQPNNHSRRQPAQEVPSQKRYEPPPSIAEAYKAWEDIKKLIKPPRNSGRGYKPFDGDDELYSRLTQMRMLLYKYSSGMAGWTEASHQVSQLFEYGETRARRLRTWTRAFLADRHALPYSAFVNGDWNQCLLDEKPDLRHALNTHMQTLGKHVRAMDIVEFMRKPETLKEYKLKKPISLSTAQNWMKRLAYRWTKVPNGQFVDGHERADVVAYRRDVFLPTLAEYDFTTRQWTSDGAEIPLPDDGCNAGVQRVVIWYHDESTFYAHDRRIVRWVHESEDPVPRAKGEGVSLMVSDFISADYGWLRSPDGTESAQVLFKAGKNRDGYFTYEEIIDQVSKAMKILRKHYPNERHVFIYDNATTHRKRAPDSLSARKMSLKPTKDGNPMFGVEVNVVDEVTGKPVYNPDGQLKKVKIRMADARFADGSPQSLYFDNGVFKGMAQILQERGIPIKGLRAECTKFKCKPPALNCCCRRILYNQPDFRDVESLLEAYCREEGFRVIFLPKFHCELNPIEMCWGYAKRVYRDFPPSSTEEDLEENVLKALGEVPLLSIRRCVHLLLLTNSELTILGQLRHTDPQVHGCVSQGPFWQAGCMGGQEIPRTSYAPQRHHGATR